MPAPTRGGPAEPSTAPPPRVTYLVKRLELAVRAAMDGVVGELGVTALQYTALSVLQRHPGMSGAQLARRSFVSPQAGSEMTAVLERKGLVSRSPDPSNRRIRRVELTPGGRELLAACDREMDEIERAMLADLSGAEAERLAASLAACVASLTGPTGDRLLGRRGAQNG